GSKVHCLTTWPRPNGGLEILGPRSNQTLQQFREVSCPTPRSPLPNWPPVGQKTTAQYSIFGAFCQQMDDEARLHALRHWRGNVPARASPIRRRCSCSHVSPERRPLPSGRG